MADEVPVDVDALAPPEIAAKAVEEGVKSAQLGRVTMVVLAVLAGAFIAVAGLFSTTVAAGEGLPYGAVQFLSGLAFTVGLALVLVGGAELFTGNTMTLVVALAQRKLSAGRLLSSWVTVYAGNLVGSLVVAVLVLLSGQYLMGDGAVGAAALSSAEAKVQLSFVEALTSGILANFLVCMAVWLSYSARSTTDKIIAMLLPIWAFVAAGLEHSVANMYLVPIGVLIRDHAPDELWTAIGSDPADLPDLTWGSFFVDNLVPVTIGNVIGGSILVGLAYWTAYLRAGGGR